MSLYLNNNNTNNNNNNNNHHNHYSLLLPVTCSLCSTYTIAHSMLIVSSSTYTAPTILWIKADVKWDGYNFLNNRLQLSILSNVTCTWMDEPRHGARLNSRTRLFLIIHKIILAYYYYMMCKPFPCKV